MKSQEFRLKTRFLRLPLAVSGLLMLFAFGCRADRTITDAEPTEEPASVVTVVLLSTPEPTAAPTPTASPLPTDTPEPTDTPNPLLREEWYIERTEQLRTQMRTHGTLSEEALEAKLRRMEIDPSKPVIALTFDDGPMPGVTDEIVKVLDQYDARATFFTIGTRFSYDTTIPLLASELAIGCEIGNHTWSHDRIPDSDYASVFNGARYLNKTVLESLGFEIKLLRPPGGYRDGKTSEICKRLGMAVALWAQSGNVHEHDPEKIVENVHRQIVNGKELQPGDIVLLHDTKPWMVDAVKIMVPKLIDEGYQLVTVSELIGLSERGFIPGEVYHKQDENIEIIVSTPTPEP